MSSAPRVTVLLTVYNGERFLRAALESVFAQSFRDFELLVVNDGSTDGTGALLSSFTDARLRVLEQSNKGIVASARRGLSEARGEYVARLDADDRMATERLAKQVAFLDAHPQHVLVGSWIRILDDQDREVGQRTYPEEDDAIRRVILTYNPVAQPAVMFRRDAARQVGGYEEGFVDTAEDYDLWLRMGRVGLFHNLPEVLTDYRLHDGASKARGTVRQLRNTLAVKDRAFKKYGYEADLRDWMTFLLQLGLVCLPAPVIYALFRIAFLRTRKSSVRPLR